MNTQRPLSTAASLLVEQRPKAWKYFLFVQVLSDELDVTADLKRDWSMKVALRRGPLIADVPAYLEGKLHDLQQAMGSVEAIINRALPDALGTPDDDGNAEGLVYVARKLVGAYVYVLEWVVECRSARVGPEYRRLLELSEELPNQMIEELESFVAAFKNTVGRIPHALETGASMQVTLDLTLTFPNAKSIEDEMKVIAKRLGARR